MTWIIFDIIWHQKINLSSMIIHDLFIPMTGDSCTVILMIRPSNFPKYANKTVEQNSYDKATLFHCCLLCCWLLLKSFQGTLSVWGCIWGGGGHANTCKQIIFTRVVLSCLRIQVTIYKTNTLVCVFYVVCAYDIKFRWPSPVTQ